MNARDFNVSEASLDLLDAIANAKILTSSLLVRIGFTLEESERFVQETGNRPPEEDFEEIRRAIEGGTRASALAEVGTTAAAARPAKKAYAERVEMTAAAGGAVRWRVAAAVIATSAAIVAFGVRAWRRLRSEGKEAAALPAEQDSED